MKEDFLHYLWKYRRFVPDDLKTSDGQPLEILNLGEHNLDAGPDFFNARIRIGTTLWAGNVEIHIRASDWDAHQHGKDPAYKNVVLHVVYQEDKLITRPNGAPIPCLVLKNRIPAGVLTRYHLLQASGNWIACKNHLVDVREIDWKNWLDRLMVERLEKRTESLSALLKEAGNNWEELLYRRMAYSFGLTVNAPPFELLARSLPLKIIGKHRNVLFQLEALLFGQAGLLPDRPLDGYTRELKREYDFLKHKYQLRPMERSHWKFLRMRPANFPTVRIAQFASLLHHRIHLMNDVLEEGSLDEIEKAWCTPLSPYWKDHYIFDKQSVEQSKTIGKTLVHSLALNTIVPFLFLYGKRKQLTMQCERAIRLLEEVPPEMNSILEQWRIIGKRAVNASESQAMLHLKRNYCDRYRCLECAIGNAVLQKGTKTSIEKGELQ